MTMPLPENRWNFATVLTQSVLVFFLVFFVSMMAGALNDTYKDIFGDMLLPAPAQLMRAIIPSEGTGVLGLAVTLALTNLCAGIMLQATAPTPEIATRRTIFLVSTTWGVVFAGSVFALVSLLVPFICCASAGGLQLPTVEEIAAASASSRAWIVWMMLCLPALAALTLLVCKRRSSHRPTDPRES